MDGNEEGGLKGLVRRLEKELKIPLLIAPYDNK